MKNNYLYLLLIVFCISCKKQSKDSKDIELYEPVDQPGNPGIGDTLSTGIFYDTFDQQLLDNRWEKVERVWGQSSNTAYQHGGVIKENVYLNNGKLVLRALGDQYNGVLTGVNGRSNRLGGVAKTKDRFASGRFEARMKVLQVSDIGVLSTMWTFYYKEIPVSANTPELQRALDAGNVVRDGKVILNHEVDIEVKGVNLGLPLFTNWIGETAPEHKSTAVNLKPLKDNKYHIFRFDWHTGGDGEEPRIAYFIDDVLITETKTKIPYKASYFNIGNWFAWWAGNDTGTYKAPSFNSKEMLVDWVKITPFNEMNDDWTD